MVLVAPYWVKLLCVDLIALGQEQRIPRMQLNPVLVAKRLKVFPLTEQQNAMCTSVKAVAAMPADGSALKDPDDCKLQVHVGKRFQFLANAEQTTY